MKRQKRKIELLTYDERKKRSTKRIAILFFVLLVVIAVGSLSVISIKNGGLKGLFFAQTTTQPKEEEPDGPYVPPEEISGRENFLIVGTSNGGSRIYFAMLAGVDFAENRVSFLGLPMTLLTDNDKTLEEQFALGGTSQIAMQLETVLDIKIGKQITVKHKNFRSIINKLGGTVNFEVQEDINYSDTDFSLYLKPGTQALDAETFVNLFRYPNWQGGAEALSGRLGELAAAAYNQLCTEENLDKGEAFAEDLLNLLDADITITEYQRTYEKVEYMVRSGNMEFATVVDLIGRFTYDDSKEFFHFTQEGLGVVSLYFGEPNGEEA